MRMRNSEVFEEEFEDRSSSSPSSPSTCFERFLLITLTVTLTLMSILGILVGKSYLFPEEEATFLSPEEFIESLHLTPVAQALHGGQNLSKYCLTKTCVQEASYIIDMIDETVSPCDDFYSFACGGFINSNIIPDDQLEINLNTELENKILSQIRTMLEEKISKKDLKAFKYAKLMFQSCMNKTKIESIGLKQVKNLLHILGGWPVLMGHAWNEKKFNWTNSVYAFRASGFSDSYFIKMAVLPDMKRSDIRKIDIDEPGLGLDREHFMTENGTEIQAYHEYQVELAVLFGASRESAKKEMKEVLDFEMELAKITTPQENRRNESKQYNPMTIKQMNKKFPFLNWLEYINTIFPTSMHILANETVIVESLEFLTNFNKLIAKTKPRTLANYHMWRALKSSAVLLNKDVFDLRLNYRNILLGESVEGSRGKFCTTQLMNSGFSVAIGSMYVRKHITKKIKDSLKVIYSYIHKEFVRMIQNSNWMDSKTKKRALEKAKAIKIYVAYPNELLKDSKVESIYRGLKIKEGNSHLINGLYLSKHIDDFEYGNLRKKTKDTHWIEFSNVAIINAYYSLTANSLEFPAGILQGTNFNALRPNYLNMGSIGWTIAHELIHSLDDEGRQFDKKGNIANWWEPQTEKSFNDKTQCFIKQYGQMSLPEFPQLKINGINTVGENIADSGGIKLAYKAYAKMCAEKKLSEKILPGLERYTPRQLFWISAAGSYCSKIRPETQKLGIITGDHSPDKVRVLGSFANSKDFLKDFKCKSLFKIVGNYSCNLW